MVGEFEYKVTVNKTKQKNTDILLGVCVCMCFDVQEPATDPI